MVFQLNDSYVVITSSTLGIHDCFIRIMISHHATAALLTSNCEGMLADHLAILMLCLALSDPAYRRHHHMTPIETHHLRCDYNASSLTH
jgi:hypothetical protein